MDAHSVAATARTISEKLVSATTTQKNNALINMAAALEARKDDVIRSNTADMERARDEGQPGKIVNRLLFNEGKIASRVGSLKKIAALPDPVGQTIQHTRCTNGLRAARVRVPLGVVLMIYEARPHVTVNAGAFCLKSGNASILRGGSEARECNSLLGELWSDALEAAGLPPDAVQVISGSHEEVGQLLDETANIDIVIPRGGKGLIKTVSERSKIPVLKHFEGVCHVYLDLTGDLQQGTAIALDGKCLMPEVCNATETLLVHEQLLGNLPGIVDAFREHGVLVKGCEATRRAVPDVEAATEEDWRTEYLDMIISVRVVGGVGEAIEHINTYGSHHTDAIVTDSGRSAEKFVNEVDSAVVLVNASTMFCDGATLGMGAEIGISTDKIHARGPMGLEDLTSYKFVIRGDGHIMGQARPQPSTQKE